MKFFDKFFGSSQEKEIELKFIFHFQKMLAFQQLFMERYNDALAEVAGFGELKERSIFAPDSNAR